MKQTVETIILALILAFIFRAFVVEAFIIPTGSMAPTLLGQHLRIVDPASGQAFTVEVPDRARNGAVTAKDLVVTAPLSGHRITIPAGTRIHAGDRILVDKVTYTLARPRRFDVAVFKSPETGHGPRSNFVKRLVGLPNEQLYFFDGDIFTRSGQDPVFRIARKTDPDTNPRWEQVQRAVFQTLYDSRYASTESQTNSAFGRDPHAAWTSQGRWTSTSNHRFDYAGEGPGSLELDFSRIGISAVIPHAPFNQLLSASPAEPLRDLAVAVDVQPDAAGLHAALSMSARIDDIDGTLRFMIQSDGSRVLEFDHAVSGPARAAGLKVLATSPGATLPAKRATSLELWWVDREAIGFVDGEPVLRWEKRGTFDAARDRQAAVRFQTSVWNYKAPQR